MVLEAGRGDSGVLSKAVTVEVEVGEEEPVEVGVDEAVLSALTSGGLAVVVLATCGAAVGSTAGSAWPDGWSDIMRCCVVGTGSSTSGATVEHSTPTHPSVPSPFEYTGGG